MLWFFWYLSTIAVAFVWLLGGGIGPRLFYGEAIAASVAIGTVGSTWIVYLAACFMTSLTTFGVMVATGLMWFVATRRWDSFSREYKAMRDRGLRRDDTVAFLLVLALALFLYPTYSARMIPTSQGRIISGGSCYGDLPIHMTIAESFLVGCNQRISWQMMQSPIFSGAHMTYPFLPDFHAAIIVRLGGSMRDGFLLPGFVMASSLWALIYYFTLRVTRSRLGGVFAVFLVLCAGGSGGWRWIMSEYQAGLEQGRGFYDAWEAALGKDVVQHDPTGEWKYLWFAFVPHIMLPQRGANFAYPVALFVLELVWMATDSNTRLHQGARRTMLITAGVLSASLPMVQAHSFIGLGLIIGVMALFDAHKWLADAHLFWSWAGAGVAALVCAYPQMTQFTATVQQGFYGKFIQYGWLFNNYEFGEPHNNPLGLFNFWCYNLGPALPLFLFAMVAAGLEMAAARKLANRLSKDDGSTGIARYLASLTAVSENVGEPNPVPPAPKSVAGSERPLPATVLRLARSLNLDRIDAVVAPWNSLSPTGRAFDTIKLGLGGLLVLLVSNYINFQPWDRDNAKIYYIFVFVAAPLNGAILAAPFEYFADSWAARPGLDRIWRWFGATSTGEGREGSGGGSGGGNGKGVGGATMIPPGSPASSSPTKLSQTSASSSAAAAHSSSSASSTSSIARLGFAHVGRVISIPLFLGCILSGAMMMLQEYRDGQYGGGVLMDEDNIRMAAWIRGHTHPRAVIMHSNYHVQPSNALAGRPSLVAYYGWVSNHGYNANDRLHDRDYVLDHALMDSDAQAVDYLKKWKVRYVLGENLKRHDRSSNADADMYLDGALKRVHSEGRFDLLEVTGYASRIPE